MHLLSPEHTDVFIFLSVLQNHRDCSTSSSISPSLHSSLNKQAPKPWWQPAHGASCKARRSLFLACLLGHSSASFLWSVGTGDPTSLCVCEFGRATSRSARVGWGAVRCAEQSCPGCWVEQSRVLSGAPRGAELSSPLPLGPAAARGSALGAQELGTAQRWRWWHKVRWYLVLGLSSFPWDCFPPTSQ